MADNNSSQTNSGNDSRQGDNQGSSMRAWRLVVVMLIALTILVIFVIVWPLDSTCQEQQAASGGQAGPAAANANSNANLSVNTSPTGNTNGGGTATNGNQNTGTPAPPQPTPAPSKSANDPCLQFRTTILDRRKDFLALLVSAFGAWIGAGAAYFFGRENLHAATDSLLRMQQQTTPVDRLRTTLVSQVPPKPIPWIAQKTDTLGAAYDWLKADTSRWFIPVVDETGALVFVIKGEALYHYYIDTVEAAASSPSAKPRDTPLSKVITDINTDDKYKLFRQVYVVVGMNTSVETANELMDRQNIFLAIVADEHRKPTHFITTQEVRRLLLK